MPTFVKPLYLVPALGLMLSCSGDDPADGGVVDAAAVDTGLAMSMDTGVFADAAVDAGPVDIGPADTGPVDTGAPDTGPTDTGAPDAGAVTGIPNPPNQPAFDWPDTEPNDTPQQAVSVGNLEFAMWMGFSAVPSAINSNTDVDYYVFRTPDAAGLAQILDVGFTIFWNQQVNLLDMRLYEVNNGTMGALVAEGASENLSQEELLDGTMAPALLQPETVYLLEVAAAPGLNITDPVLYNA